MNGLIYYIWYSFNPNNFEAHGSHFGYVPGLLWTMVIANIVIFIAYILIPLALFYFIRKRKDFTFKWVFVLFGAFIVSCGLHHLVHVITFWYPIYGIESVIDVITALVSIGTFFALLPVLPVALKYKSPEELENFNQELAREVATRRVAEQELLKKNQELETHNKEIIEKNQEFERMNKLMVDRELAMVELKAKITELEKK